MKISFLVTYYNQEGYVRDSMESLLAIDKPAEWEILIGDDGSTDRTMEMIRKYLEKDPEHIRCYRMPRVEEEKTSPVLRASANRLNLLEHCTGDCFCILDGDDFYCDRAFAVEAIRILEEQEDTAVVMYGFRMFDGAEYREEYRLPSKMAGRVDTRKYLSRYYLHAGAGVHRLSWGKKRLNEIRNTGFFDDNDIVINSLNYGGMYYIDRCIYAYRQTGGSVYTSMSEIERALLNAQGYDVDRLLVSDCYKNEMMVRNSEFLLQVFFLRERIREIIGVEHFDRMLCECKNIKNSITYRILIYRQGSRSNRRIVRKEIRKIMLLKPRAMIKFLLK